MLAVVGPDLEITVFTGRLVVPVRNVRPVDFINAITVGGAVGIERSAPELAADRTVDMLVNLFPFTV